MKTSNLWLAAFVVVVIAGGWFLVDQWRTAFPADPASTEATTTNSLRAPHQPAQVVRAPLPADAGVVVLDGDSLMSWSVPAPSDISWEVSLPDEPATLQFAMGAAGKAANFSVVLETSGTTVPVMQHRVAPAKPARWQHAGFSLAEHAGKDVTLRFRTDGPASAGNANVWWGNPRLFVPPGGDDFSVVMFIVGGMRADFVSGSGFPLPITPTLDELIESGAEFRNAVTASLDERESLAMLVNGSSSSNAGLASILTGANFRSALFTSADLGDTDMELPVTRTRDSADTIQRALHWWRRHQADRVFVVIHLDDPLPPHEAPPQFVSVVEKWYREGPARAQEHPVVRANADQALTYAAEVAHCDYQLSRFIAGIRQMGLMSHCIFAVTSTHGTRLTEARSQTHGLYQENVAVPLVIYFEGRIPGPLQVHTLTQTLDLAPSILQWVGLDVPAGLLGVRLIPAFRGIETRGVATLGNGSSQVIRDRRYKLIVSENYEELYDLVEDPGEKQNRRSQFPDVADRLRSHRSP